MSSNASTESSELQQAGHFGAAPACAGAGENAHLYLAYCSLIVDAVGNRTVLTETQAGATRITRYSFDVLNRLALSLIHI